MTKTQIRCCRARQLFGAERSRCSAGRGGRSHIAEFSTEFCPDSPLPWSPRRAKRLGSTLAVAARYRRRPGRFPAISGIRRAEMGQPGQPRDGARRYCRGGRRRRAGAGGRGETAVRDFSRTPLTFTSFVSSGASSELRYTHQESRTSHDCIVRAHTLTHIPFGTCNHDINISVR